MLRQELCEIYFLYIGCWNLEAAYCSTLFPAIYGAYSKFDSDATIWESKAKLAQQVVTWQVILQMPWLH